MAAKVKRTPKKTMIVIKGYQKMRGKRIRALLILSRSNLAN